MAKKQPGVTAKTMTLEHLPTPDHRPEEFLRDEDLVGLYERQLATLPEADSKARRRVQRQLNQARIAAAITAAVDPDAELFADEEDDE